jgi:O-antigen ligase
MTLTHRILDWVIFYGLLITLVITAIPYGSVQPWWIALFESLVFIFAALATLDLIITKEWFPRTSAVALPLLVFCLFLLLQSLALSAAHNSLIPDLRLSISADPDTTQLLALKIFAFIAMGVLVLRYVNSEARLLTLAYVVIGIGVASAIFGILRHGSGGPSWFFPLPNPERGFAQFVNRNHFGFLMEMTFGLALGLTVKGARGLKRWVFLPIAAFLWIALVIANSRGAIFGSLCQVLFLIILVGPLGLFQRSAESRPPFSKLAIQGLLIVFLIGAFAYGVRWVGGESVVSNLEITSYSYTEQGGHERRENVSRRDLWLSSWKLIKAHPLVGSGLGAYWIAITKYHDASGALAPREAHNDYLEFLAGVGIVGTALVLWFATGLVSNARRALRSGTIWTRAAALGACVGLFGAMVHGLVDFGLHITANAVVFTVLISIVIAAVQLTDNSTALPVRASQSL